MDVDVSQKWILKASSTLHSRYIMIGMNILHFFVRENFVRYMTMHTDVQYSN
jgi:hypothetical protein